MILRIQVAAAAGSRSQSTCRAAAARRTNEASPSCTIALAAGATLTYVWLAFPMPPSDGGSPTMDLVSNVVFGSVAVILLVLAGLAAARTHHYDDVSTPSSRSRPW